MVNEEDDQSRESGIHSQTAAERKEGGAKPQSGCHYHQHTNIPGAMYERQLNANAMSESDADIIRMLLGSIGILLMLGAGRGNARITLHRSTRSILFKRMPKAFKK